MKKLYVQTFGLIIGALAAAKPMLGTEANDIPESLLSARRAYMEGNQDLALSELKTTFEQNRKDAAVTGNAFGLLRQVINNESTSAPPDTKLPPELSYFMIQVRRDLVRNGQVQYTLDMRASQKTTAQISMMKLSYFDGDTLLDSATGLGKVTRETIGQEKSYKITRHYLSSAPAEGPVEIFVNFDNGRSWHGWAPLTDLVASTSPEILYPRENEIIDTGTPTFTWIDTVSPEFKSWEKPSYWADIYDYRQDPWIDLVQKDSYNSDGLPEITVPAAKELANGSYGFVVNHGETRKFGDIRLRRAGVTFRGFTVQK